MMHLRIPALCSMLLGCGSYGLDLLNSDSGSGDGNSWLVASPNSVDFGYVDIQGSTAIETVTLTAAGSGQVVIIDISLGERTWSNFTLGSSDLPLPHFLPVNREYPLDIRFQPDYEASYDGNVEIDTENDEGGVDTLTIDLEGYGCDSGSASGCP